MSLLTHSLFLSYSRYFSDQNPKTNKKQNRDTYKSLYRHFEPYLSQIGQNGGTKEKSEEIQRCWLQETAEKKSIQIGWLHGQGEHRHSEQQQQKAGRGGECKGKQDHPMRIGFFTSLSATSHPCLSSFYPLQLSQSHANIGSHISNTTRLPYFTVTSIFLGHKCV